MRTATEFQCSVFDADSSLCRLRYLVPVDLFSIKIFSHAGHQTQGHSNLFNVKLSSMKRVLCFSFIKMDSVKAVQFCSDFVPKGSSCRTAKGTFKSAKCEPTQQIFAWILRIKDCLSSGPKSGVCQLSFVPLLLTNTIPSPFNLFECFHPGYIYLTIHSYPKAFS